MRTPNKLGYTPTKSTICKECNYRFDYPATLAKPRLCEDCDPTVFPELEQAREYFTLPAGMSRERIVAGNTFDRSPGIKSIEQMREEYLQLVAFKQTPEINKISLQLPRHGARIGINHLGDVHIGTDACIYPVFREILDWVLNNDDEYIIFQGDLVDMLTSQSVGVMGEQSQTIGDQLRFIYHDLEPLARKGKILAMLRGNHEDRLDKATRNVVDATQHIAEYLDVLYLRTEGYTQIESGGASYMSYNIHGFNAGSTAGARRNKMASMLTKFTSADIITSGHNHLLDVIQTTEEQVHVRRHPKSRYGLYTGTLHSYMGYAADFGLGQGPLGFGRVMFDVDYGFIHPQVWPTVYDERNSKYHQILPY